MSILARPSSKSDPSETISLILQKQKPEAAAEAIDIDVHKVLAGEV